MAPLEGARLGATRRPPLFRCRRSFSARQEDRLARHGGAAGSRNGRNVLSCGRYVPHGQETGTTKADNLQNRRQSRLAGPGRGAGRCLCDGEGRDRN
jgi:hypothetical protein